MLRAPGSAGRLRTSSLAARRSLRLRLLAGRPWGQCIRRHAAGALSPSRLGGRADLNLGAELAGVRLAVVHGREGRIDANLETVRSLRRRECEARASWSGPSRFSKQHSADPRRPVHVAEEADLDGHPSRRARPAPALAPDADLHFRDAVVSRNE